MTDQKLEVKELEKEIYQEGFATPAVNIYENADVYKLVAEMPGVNKETLALKFEEDFLTILGKRKFDNDSKMILQERRHLNFYRRFKIGNTIDAEKIQAKLEDGLLIVTLPKHDRVKPRTIEIK